jgi:hypothetical protein
MNAREFRFDYAATNVGMRRLAEDLGMADHAEGSHSIARRLLGGAAQDAPAVAS